VLVPMFNPAKKLDDKTLDPSNVDASAASTNTSQT
jgi:two-component system nitrogen regulation sensor histidine kinase GlnL